MNASSYSHDLRKPFILRYSPGPTSNVHGIYSVFTNEFPQENIKPDKWNLDISDVYKIRARESMAALCETCGPYEDFDDLALTPDVDPHTSWPTSIRSTTTHGPELNRLDHNVSWKFLNARYVFISPSSALSGNRVQEYHTRVSSVCQRLMNFAHTSAAKVIQS